MIFIGYMSKKRKIILTESQYKVLTEANNVFESFNDFLDSSIKIVNRQFSKLVFSNLIEVLKGEIDLDDLNKAMVDMNLERGNKDDAINVWRDNPRNDDNYWDNWHDYHSELEKKNQMLEVKIESVILLCEKMAVIRDIDVENNFSDIETKNI
jgi:hypothetical protein